MKPVICLGLAAGAALVVAAGCANSPGVVRGQSPVVQQGAVAEGPIIGTAPAYAEHARKMNAHRDYAIYNGHRTDDFGYEGGYYDGKEQYYANHWKQRYEVGGGTGCPACNGGASCPAGGCQHCGYGCDHSCPDHYHTYKYKWPQNLVYPPAVQPAGMVQYPYYTLRGPTDFFMK